MKAPKLTILGRLQMAYRMRVTGSCVLHTLGGISLVALLCLAADAILILPADVRMAAPWLAVALVTLMILRLLWKLGRNTLLRTALRLEAEKLLPGASVSTAVELSTVKPSDEVNAFLRDQSITRAMAQATQAKATSVFCYRMGKAFRFVAISAALIAIAYLICPQVFDAVLPRYLDPMGDHPPYSSMRFSLTCTPTDVVFGEGCTIHARVEGGTPERLFLAVQAKGEPQKSTMFIRPDGSFVQTLANLRDPVTCWVTDGRGRSLRTTIGIRYTPQITNVAITQVFPDYTRLPEKTIESFTAEELMIPQGTALTLTLQSNRPLSGGEMVLMPLDGSEEQRLALTPIDGSPSMLTAAWVPTTNTAFTCMIRDINGLSCTQPVRGRVTLTPDKKPRLMILEPGRHAIATPESAIPVRLRAEDDYGIAGVLYFRGHNASIECPVPLTVIPSPTSASVISHAVFNLADLGVKPGDRIDYFFEAQDTCPDTPHITASRLYSLEIISEEQFRSMVRRRLLQRKVFERELSLASEMRRIAERTRAMKKKMDETKPEDRNATFQKAMTDEMQQINHDLQKSREHTKNFLKTPDFFDIDASFKKSFDEQLKRLQAMEELTAQASQGMGVPMVEAIDELVDLMQTCQDQTTEEVETPALRLREVVMLLAEAQRFAALAAQQQQIARLTLRYRDSNSENERLLDMECAEFATAEEVIGSHLDEIMNRLPELLAALPKEEAYEELRTTTEKFIKDVKEANIPECILAAKNAFNEPEPAEGHLQASEAADRMMRLVAITQSMPGMGKSCLAFQPKLSTNMGNSLEQILSALKDNGGKNGSGGNGYSIAGDDLAMYGPDMPDMKQGGGSGDVDNDTTGATPDITRVAASAPDDFEERDTSGNTTIQLQENVRYPLRYRTLVGAYFRAVMDIEEEHRHE